MDKPLIVSLTTGERETAKGIVTGVDGLQVSVSILAVAGKRLDCRRTMRRGQEVRITFFTEAFGDTPPIRSELVSVSREAASYELTCTVIDWQSLAEFWARALQSAAADDRSGLFAVTS